MIVGIEGYLMKKVNSFTFLMSKVDKMELL
jgi:hypothetical protein